PVQYQSYYSQRESWMDKPRSLTPPPLPPKPIALMNSFERYTMRRNASAPEISAYRFKRSQDTETLIIFLCNLDINLDEDDFKILRKQKIDGQTFPDMTEKKFMKDGKIEYFWLFPCGEWSLQHFISWSTNLFRSTERNETHTVFYNTLYIFCDDPMASQEILEVVRNLLLNKKVNRKKGCKPLANISNLQKEVVKKPLPSKSDLSIDILEILKTAHYIKVSRESIYNAEMYRVLVNWLRKIHGYEITGQWHLEQVCNDGNYHHLYCDLTIKKPDSSHLEALLELLATASIPKLNGYFKQVFKYKEQLYPQEI
ncbi:9584_t:CDS:2, partial [Funneliformis mosseae]